MQTNKELFKKYIAQTSTFDAFVIDVAKAEGIYVWDKAGKEYMDMMSGIAVSNIGHRHPEVIKAIKEQVDQYLHVMVYGEFAESPQVKLAKRLADLLPDNLNMTFFVNSGSEAIEGALKLARKYNKRSEIIAFKGGYHGSTLGAVSILGDEAYKQVFRPLIPDVKILEFNNIDVLDEITDKTSCVVTEVIQAGSGIRLPNKDFLLKLRKKCTETGTLLIFDEIQTGFGRTGELFAFKHYGIVPDVLCIAKSMGGGMPIGAFISSNIIMDSLNDGHPLLGHATTFGGHPVSCAASLAALEVLINENIMADVDAKAKLFKDYLQVHPNIKEIRNVGLFMAIELKDASNIEMLVESCMNNGIITYWFLYNHNSLSIVPPLTIINDEIKEACTRILKSLE